jgi:riboflavin synthase
MFTGLVELLGTVTQAQAEPPGMRLVVDAGNLAQDATLGASICVSGCCLSIVAMDGPLLTFELGPETLAKTSLFRLAAGGRVNLERSLQVSDRLGGHLVTGHVDAVGELVSRVQEGDWVTCRFSASEAILAQMVPKGSIAVDGVSLTVVDVTDREFSVALIPHTLAITTLGTLAVGDTVNLETDLIGKYVTTRLEAWLAAGGRPGEGDGPSIADDILARRGQS